MKKDINITKYEIEWQILRASIKGSKIVFEDKLSAVKSYFDARKSKERWERCVNYLEGLAMGYKASKSFDKIILINDEIKSYGLKDDYDYVENNDISSEYDKMFKYDYKERLVLIKDLYRTNKKWLEKGYFHKDCNKFLDMLYDVSEKLNEKISDSVSKNNVEMLREKCKGMENTHSFFF